jgi:hypothetical protein
MPFEGDAIVLNKQQRSELEEIARSGSMPAGFVLRSKILLAQVKAALFGDHDHSERGAREDLAIGAVADDDFARVDLCLIRDVAAMAAAVDVHGARSPDVKCSNASRILSFMRRRLPSELKRSMLQKNRPPVTYLLGACRSGATPPTYCACSSMRFTQNGSQPKPHSAESPGRRIDPAPPPRG